MPGYCKWYIIFASFVFNYTTCKTTARLSNEGTIIFRHRVYDSSSKQFIMTVVEQDRKIWFRDSFIIEPSFLLNISKDENGEKWDMVTDHYVFIDLKKRMFYEYSSFSDTAKLLKKYSQPDSVNITGGWNFYKYNKLMNEENMRNLPDTIIDGIEYKRLQSSKQWKLSNGDWNYTYIAWLRCDKKNSIFHIDRSFDEKMNCPMVKFAYMVEGRSPWISDEIFFETDRLGDNERKIFMSWEKVANANQ